MNKAVDLLGYKKTLLLIMFISFCWNFFAFNSSVEAWMSNNCTSDPNMPCIVGHYIIEFDCSPSSGGAVCSLKASPAAGGGGKIPNVAIPNPNGINVYDNDSLCGNFYTNEMDAKAAVNNRNNPDRVYNSQGCVNGDYRYGMFNEKYYSDASINPEISGKFVYNGVTYVNLASPAEPYKATYNYTGDNVCLYYMSYWAKNGSAHYDKKCLSLPRFKGTSRVLAKKDNWSDDMMNNGTGVQLSPLWKPDSSGALSYTADRTLVLQDCSVQSGCKAYFRHYLKRDQGDENTVYSIDRSVNGESSNIVKNVINSGDNNNNMVREDEVIIYPGQRVCETLKFMSRGSSDEVSVTVCAVAVGRKESTINMKVRKNGDGWRVGNIYTKPGDKIDLLGSYAPDYQEMYNPVASTTNGYNNDGRSIGKTFDANVTPKWNNAFSIKINGECNDNFYNSVGNSEEYFGAKNNYRIRVGSKSEVQAVTNCNEATRTTPNRVRLYLDNGKFVADVDTGAKSSNTVNIISPYNFENSIELIGNDGGIMYAGETSSASIKYKVNVGTRQNNMVGDNYATAVNGVGSVKVEICSEGDCYEETVVENQTWNSENKLSGWSSSESDSVKVPIDDIPAGSEVCVRAAVYPANSGADDNLDPRGSNSWTEYGEPKCSTVAKKPSFQVWGGSVYSGGDIKAPLAEKTNLAGYNLSGGTQMFGSWAEWEVVHNGKNQWLASGAGLGYANNNNGTLWPAVRPDDGNGNISNNDKGSGGNNGNDFCKVSTLTFPNSNCNSVAVGSMSNTGKVNDIGEGVIGGLVGVEKDDDRFKMIGNNNTIDLNKLVSAEKTQDGVKYYNYIRNGFTGWLSIKNEKNDVEIQKEDDSSPIVVIKSDTNISIDANIEIGGEYQSLKEVPEVVIYAKGSIYVSNDVNRIDAVLIADESINTCGSYNPSDETTWGRCSKQLKINGALVAGGKVLFNRIYGAATGANSMVPAEVINYNPALYLLDLGVSSETTTQSTIWEQVYTRELAPRY